MNPLLTLFVVCVIDVLGFGIMVPLVPYMADRFGATPSITTWILGSYSLCQFLAAPLWGRLSDRFGRRPILISSLCGAALSYLLLAHANSLGWLLLSRALAGAMAGNVSAAMAYATDVSKPEQRARAMGTIGAAIGLGFMLGPAIGGALAGNDERVANFTTPALVSFALALLALLLVAWRLKESYPAEARARHLADQVERGRWALLRTNPALRLIALAALLVTFSQSTLESIFALWAMKRFSVGPAMIGYSMFMLAIVAVLMQGVLVRRLAPRYGEHRLALLAIVSYAAGLLVVAFSPALPGVIVGLMLVGLGAGAFNPSGSTLASREAGVSNRGAVMGAYQSSTALARVIGPLTSGPVYTHFGSSAPFLLGGLVTLQAIWCILGAHRRHVATVGNA
ncbi:MAG: MFS transporter [Steroidobacteraceae bacterium]